MRLGRLHVIVGGYGGHDPVALAHAAIDGGAQVIQVRMKGVSDRRLFEVVSVVANLCRAKSRCCIVNDRFDIALAAGADGVHLGAEDLPVAAVRRVVGREFIIGATARDPYVGRQLESKGATYLGVGPCFATSTKEGLPDPLGLEGLSAVAKGVKCPVIAIGGIDASNAAEVLTAGAYGVAVVSAVAGASDPKAATQSLAKAIQAALSA